MTEKGTNILEGEASESDEELTDYPLFVKNTMVSEPSPPSTPSVEAMTPSVGGTSGVVVSGEASESDDEMTESVGTRHFPSLQVQGMVDYELQVEEDTEMTSTPSRRRPLPKYQSPLHKKLREQNFSLRCGIVEVTLDHYERAHLRLQSSIPFLTKAQNDVQDTLHTIRKTADNVDLITHRLKMINETTVLPPLVFPN